MPILVLRALPLLTAIVSAVAAFSQWRFPLLYPWPLIVAFLFYISALFLIAHGRLSWREGLEKLVPSLLAIGSFIGGFLLIEGSFERIALTLLFIVVPFSILELLFLAAYDTSRYPVNGLSRLNLALVPLVAFFLAQLLNGLSVFLRSPLWLSPVVFTMIGFLLYLLTSHPTADRAQRLRWACLGAMISFQIGVLNYFLPYSMIMHGAMSAILLAIPLRIRRYAYAPVPSKKLAWGEGIFVVLAFIAMLASTRWV